MKTQLTTAELQQIEHQNKMLREHLDLVQRTMEESKKMFDIYIPILQDYIRVFRGIQLEFTRVALEMLKSGKELRGVTGGYQEVFNYTQAAVKLNEALSDELIQKIIKISSGDGK